MTNESALRILVRSLLRESPSSSLLPPGVTHDFFVAWYRRCGDDRFNVNVPHVTKRLIGVGFSPEEATALAKLAADCLDPSHPVPKTTKLTAWRTISRGLRPGVAPLALIKKTIIQENFGTRDPWMFVIFFKMVTANEEGPDETSQAGWMPNASRNDGIYEMIKNVVSRLPNVRREDMEREMDFVEAVSYFEEPKQVPVRNLRRLLVQGVDGIMQAAQIYRDL